MAEVLSVDDRPGSWDVQLSELQDLYIQLESSSRSDIADAWELIEHAQVYLAHISDEFAEYIRRREDQMHESRQHESRQQESRQQSSQHNLQYALQQLLSQRDGEQQQQLERQHQIRRQPHTDELDLEALLEALQLRPPSQHHHQRHNDGDRDDHNDGDLDLAPLRGIFQLFGQVLRQL